MEKSALLPLAGASAAEAAARAAVVGRTGSGSSSPPPAVPAQLGDGRRGESDAEFLARQAAADAGVGPRQTFARFVVDQKTHQVSVHIIDASSQEVVRTIPNEDLRQMAQRFRASQGILLDSAV